MQITGKFFIDVPGIGRLRTQPGAKLMFGGSERTGVTSDIGPVGFQEGDFVYPSLECNVIHGADTKVNDFRNIKNATISIETDTGKRYSLQQAWNTNAVDLDSKGVMAVKFQGIRVDEV